MKNGPYILSLAPPEYPGKKYRGKYAYEHHLVWWKHSGFTIPEGYSIHHKNEEPHDNRLENLELISRSTHVKIHRPKKDIGIALICGYCKCAFVRMRRNVIYKQKSGQKIFYCCRSHQVIQQHINAKYLSGSSTAELVPVKDEVVGSSPTLTAITYV